MRKSNQAFSTHTQTGKYLPMSYLYIYNSLLYGSKQYTKIYRNGMSCTYEFITLTNEYIPYWQHQNENKKKTFFSFRFAQKKEKFLISLRYKSIILSYFCAYENFSFTFSRYFRCFFFSLNFSFFMQHFFPISYAYIQCI